MPSRRSRDRAVLFDLGGTLVNEVDFNELADAAMHVGIDAEPEALVQSFREAEEEYDRSWGKLPFPKFWALVFSRATGAAVTEERAMAVADRERERPFRHQLFSDVVRCLDALKEKYLLGVVSNSRSKERVDRILATVGILDRFTVTVSSGSEAVAKPDPEIFHRAVARIGVPAASTVYVGNLANVDARAAARAGLVGVWLNRHGTGLGDDPPEITSLTELPFFVERSLAAPVK